MNYSIVILYFLIGYSSIIDGETEKEQVLDPEEKFDIEIFELLSKFTNETDIITKANIYRSIRRFFNLKAEKDKYKQKYYETMSALLIRSDLEAEEFRLLKEFKGRRDVPYLKEKLNITNTKKDRISSHFIRWKYILTYSNNEFIVKLKKTIKENELELEDFFKFAGYAYKELNKNVHGSALLRDISYGDVLKHLKLKKTDSKTEKCKEIFVKYAEETEVFRE